MPIGDEGVIVGGDVVEVGVVVSGGVVGGASVVDSGGVVGRIFLLCWSKCPWVMVAARDGYLRTNTDVISRKDAR